MTNDEYKLQLESIHPNIEVLECMKYKHIKIYHYCKIHQIKFQALPKNLLKGINSCPLCKKETMIKIKSKTHNEYLEELQKNNINYIPLEPYINSRIKILHKCLIHNVEWVACPNTILSGHGCPQCAKEKIVQKVSKKHSTYLQEIQNQNFLIQPLEQYKQSKIQIKHKCLICGYEWEISPQCVLRGHGCPRCHQSAGENKIAIWLSSYNINYITQKRFNDCRDILPLPFDFYLSDLNICIEYDGIQHFKPTEKFGGQKEFEERQYHDQIKTEYCKNNNIPLLRIPYYANVEEELEKFLA